MVFLYCAPALAISQTVIADMWYHNIVMELRHLQVLVAVAEQGSFSAAADHLGTVQSNVSAHMARLERELAATLVDRGAGRLTEEGELALARAYRVLSELEALSTDVGALRAEVTGTVRGGHDRHHGALAGAGPAGGPVVEPPEIAADGDRGPDFRSRAAARGRQVGPRRPDCTRCRGATS